MNKAVIITAYVISFIAVTLLMMFLNSKFNNIFKFDFSPRVQVAAKQDSVKNAKEMVKFSDSTNINIAGTNVNKTNEDAVEHHIADSTIKNNTTKQVNKTVVNNSKADFKNTPQKQNVPVVPQTAALQNRNKVVPISQNRAQNKGLARIDSSYTKWKKTTASIYETMDAKKAAKIIEKYSDNTARDIIYTMKKKKAADVLSEMSPEKALRITKIR